MPAGDVGGYAHLQEQPEQAVNYRLIFKTALWFSLATGMSAIWVYLAIIADPRQAELAICGQPDFSVDKCLSIVDRTPCDAFFANTSAASAFVKKINDDRTLIDFQDVCWSFRAKNCSPLNPLFNTLNFLHNAMKLMGRCDSPSPTDIALITVASIGSAVLVVWAAVAMISRYARLPQDTEENRARGPQAV